VVKLEPGINRALVDDVLYPTQYTALIPELRPFDHLSKLYAECQEYLAWNRRAACEQARRLPQGKVAVGKIFAIGCADGQAWYLVTRVSKSGKTCSVEWRGWGGLDGYFDHHFGYGLKRVPVAQVAKYILLQDRLDEAFNPKGK
jgi:hypothetical protein